MQEIFNRRSIRKYQNNTIPFENIKKILKAGMAAPSAGNQQPWQFVVITESEIKNRIMAVHTYGKMLGDAPAAILICGDRSREKHSGFWVQDCSAATQNMLLMIESLGLGGVWLGVYPDQKRVKAIADILNIPDNITPFSLIALGYPAESKPPNDRYSDARVHFDRW